MPLYKSSNSPYWQIRFDIAGVEVRRSSGTRDRRAAQELEKQLQDELWRQVKLGEQRWTWADAVDKFTTEKSGQRSWDRTKRSLEVLNEYIAPDDPLAEVDYDCLLKIRSLLEVRACKGNGRKTKGTWKKSTCNRVLAVAGAILSRCASSDWKKMIPSAPNIPRFQLDKIEPKWITREQARLLLARFPEHTRDMVMFALATGLRKSNVAGLEWSVSTWSAAVASSRVT